jgi:hypothetical protein
MVLCASNNNHTVVKLSSVPVEVRIGERATDPGVDYRSDGPVPFGENKIGKRTLRKRNAFPYDGQLHSWY